MKWFTIGVMTLFSLFFSNVDGARIISGNDFKAMSDFYLDETGCTIIPSSVSEGSLIFVKTDYVDSFFTQFHPQISHRYVLITHNSDYSNPGRFASYLDDKKLIAWFGQNIDFVHPKFHPIPIGMANERWTHGNQKVLTTVIFQTAQYKKEYLLYMNFTQGNYLNERGRVYGMFATKSFCYKTALQPFENYLIDLAKSQFVLSPRGNGLDCHRTWEALLLGSFPIVTSSLLDPLYDDLPVVIVQDWNEITAEFLNKKYEEMSQKTYNLDKLYVPYWNKLIRSYAAQ